MPTLTQARPQIRPQRSKSIPDYTVEPADIEDVSAEYPQEYIEELEREFELARLQIATGELKPMSVAEYAAKKGIKLNG
jgi:hypothetical protein